MDQCRRESKRDSDAPDRAIALRHVEDVIADPDFGKGAALMAEEDDAEQHRHVTHTKDVHDDAADKGERAELGEADAGGEEHDRDRRERQQNEA